MFKAWKLSKTLPRSDDERKLMAKGYWKGAEVLEFRLWWNDDDEMVVEEKKEDLR